MYVLPNRITKPMTNCSTGLLFTFHYFAGVRNTIDVLAVGQTWNEKTYVVHYIEDDTTTRRSCSFAKSIVNQLLLLLLSFSSGSNYECVQWGISQRCLMHSHKRKRNECAAFHIDHCNSIRIYFVIWPFMLIVQLCSSHVHRAVASAAASQMCTHSKHENNAMQFLNKCLVLVSLSTSFYQLKIRREFCAHCFRYRYAWPFIFMMFENRK